MKSIRSLGYRTDVAVAAFDGVIVERERYLVVRTPSNPTFWWGNFLLYPEPPDDRAASKRGDGSWFEDLARETSDGPEIPLLVWDRPDGATGETRGFVDEGFELDTSSVLTATAESLVRPPRCNDDVRVEPLVADSAWLAAASMLTRAFAPRRNGTVDSLREFVDRQLVRYRAMQAASAGQWYGAYLGGELAATLGLVRAGDVGRFQLVGTDPRFSRQGVCSTLVHSVARRGLEEQGFATLVMCADASYHAARVYESVGFEPTEKLVALLRRPPLS